MITKARGRSARWNETAPLTVWLAAAITYTGWCTLFLWEDLPLGAITAPLAFAAVCIGYGYLLGARAVVLSLLWSIPVFFLSGNWDSREGEVAVSIFFGVLLGASGLLVGALLAHLRRQQR